MSMKPGAMILFVQSTMRVEGEGGEIVGAIEAMWLPSMRREWERRMVVV